MANIEQSERILKLLHHRRHERKLRRVAHMCRKRFFTGCFSELEIIGLEKIIEGAERGGRFIFIPNHQSEYDWLILQTVLVESGIQAAIQAGNNLFIGPLDPFLRHCGAFMSIRDEQAFYSRSWILNWLLRMLGKRPFVVTKEMYGAVYAKQLQQVLGDDGLHLIVFPGYETDPFSGAVKYGRSYSGELSSLSPFVFTILGDAVRKTSQLNEAAYVPVNISYERVPEDILFREFTAKSSRSQIAKYVYDHYYTFAKAPISRWLRNQRSRACLKFGDPIEVPPNGGGRQVAECLRKELGDLCRVYESMLVFASIDTKFRMARKVLERKAAKNLQILETEGIDTSPLYDTEGKPLSIEEMLARTVKIFNFPRIPIIPSKSYVTIEYDDNEVFIHHPHLASYYGNKLKHLLRQQA